MKKRFLVIAIAAGLVSPLAANAEANVYGIAHAALTSASGDDSKDSIQITSQNSRVGVKGSEDLGGGLKAVYKMEFSVDIAENGQGGLGGRNQYVGLSSAMGTVLLGRHDTPVKMAQGSFDVFNDTVADMAGSVTYMGTDYNMVDGEDRAGNVLAYVSPQFGAVKVVAALVPGEDAAGGNDGIADGTSFAVMYEAKDLFVSLGMNGGDLMDDQTRLVATYQMDNMGFGFLYSTTDFGTADDQVSMGISASAKVDANTFKLQYIDATDMNGSAGADETRTTVGVDHAMSKATSVYALFDSFSELDMTNVSFGMVHKF